MGVANSAGSGSARVRDAATRRRSSAWKHAGLRRRSTPSSFRPESPSPLPVIDDLLGPRPAGRRLDRAVSASGPCIGYLGVDLAKRVRDAEENQTVYARADQARVERIWPRIDPFKAVLSHLADGHGGRRQRVRTYGGQIRPPCRFCCCLFVRGSSAVTCWYYHPARRPGPSSEPTRLSAEVVAVRTASPGRPPLPARRRPERERAGRQRHRRRHRQQGSSPRPVNVQPRSLGLDAAPVERPRQPRPVPVTEDRRAGRARTGRVDTR